MEDAVGGARVARRCLPHRRLPQEFEIRLARRRHRLAEVPVEAAAHEGGLRGLVGVEALDQVGTHGVVGGQLAAPAVFAEAHLGVRKALRQAGEDRVDLRLREPVAAVLVLVVAHEHVVEAVAQAVPGGDVRVDPRQHGVAGRRRVLVVEGERGALAAGLGRVEHRGDLGDGVGADPVAVHLVAHFPDRRRVLQRIHVATCAVAGLRGVHLRHVRGIQGQGHDVGHGGELAHRVHVVGRRRAAVQHHAQRDAPRQRGKRVDLCVGIGVRVVGGRAQPRPGPCSGGARCGCRCFGGGPVAAGAEDGDEGQREHGCQTN